MSWVNPKWMEAAILEAKQGLEEGGLPIGSVLVDPLSGVEGIKTARVIYKIRVNNLPRRTAERILNFPLFLSSKQGNLAREYLK